MKKPEIPVSGTLRKSFDPGSTLMVASNVLTTDEFDNRVVRAFGKAAFITDLTRSSTCCLLN